MHQFSGTEIYGSSHRKNLQQPLMTMVGWTTAGRHCHPANPPPTQYKPPRMSFTSPTRTLSITKTENQVTRPMGQNCTTAYAAAKNSYLTSTEKSTMTPHPQPTSYHYFQNYKNQEILSKCILIMLPALMLLPSVPQLIHHN